MNRTGLIREPGRQASATTSARGKDTVRRTGLRDRGGQQGKGQPDRKTGPRGQPQQATRGQCAFIWRAAGPVARYLLPDIFCLTPFAWQRKTRGWQRASTRTERKAVCPARNKENKETMRASLSASQPAQRTGGQGTGRSHATPQKHDKTMNKRRQ